MKNILVTGGMGYIGSHTVVELIEEGYNPIIVDNLSNSKKDTLDKLEKITNKKIIFYENDVRDRESLKLIFEKEKIDGVIHFAGLKAVGESVEKPLEYYDNNLISTLVLLEVMREYNCKTFVFSSSATVYGDPKYLPIDEEHPLSTTNPYGATKLYIEGILKDLYKSNNEYKIAILRYFNPVGTHESHIIGENCNGKPNNLVPYIVKVATGELEELSIFGDDYDTTDGTGVRDYIHVVDLAKGHIKALQYLEDTKTSNLLIVNLGTGKGNSVLELVEKFEEVNGLKLKYKIVGRRPGDIATCYADTKMAEKLLSWKAEKTLVDMLKSAYEYEKNKKNNL